MRRGLSFAGAVLVAAGAVFGAVGHGHAADAGPRVIEVTAGEFKFEPAVINVTEGERVVLKARTTDGRKHGFGIKELDVKAALPKTGEVVAIELTGPAPGTYTIACSVYCGSGHSRMKGQLVVAARR
jgi:cytochrome c oxidase subunit 2